MERKLLPRPRVRCRLQVAAPSGVSRGTTFPSVSPLKGCELARPLAGPVLSGSMIGGIRPLETSQFANSPARMNVILAV